MWTWMMCERVSERECVCVSVCMGIDVCVCVIEREYGHRCVYECVRIRTWMCVCVCVVVVWFLPWRRWKRRSRP
jgi:hypothetical protein